MAVGAYCIRPCGLHTSLPIAYVRTCPGGGHLFRARPSWCTPNAPYEASTHPFQTPSTATIRTAGPRTPGGPLGPARGPGGHPQGDAPTGHMSRTITLSHHPWTRRTACTASRAISSASSALRADCSAAVRHFTKKSARARFHCSHTSIGTTAATGSPWRLDDVPVAPYCDVLQQAAEMAPHFEGGDDLFHDIPCPLLGFGARRS